MHGRVRYVFLRDLAGGFENTLDVFTLHIEGIFLLSIENCNSSQEC